MCTTPSSQLIAKTFKAAHLNADRSATQLPSLVYLVKVCKNRRAEHFVSSYEVVGCAHVDGPDANNSVLQMTLNGYHNALFLIHFSNLIV
jgi:hypothetical protein